MPLLPVSSGSNLSSGYGYGEVPLRTRSGIPVLLRRLTKFKSMVGFLEGYAGR